MISQEEARTRVTRGAAHLDVHRPGWFNKVDIGTLDQALCDRCMLGQLFGDFWDGIISQWGHQAARPIARVRPASAPRETRFTVPSNDEAHTIAAEHGFALKQMDWNDEDDFILAMNAGYRSLQDAWIAAIADRRLSTTVEERSACDAIGQPSDLQPDVYARI